MRKSLALVGVGMLSGVGMLIACGSSDSGGGAFTGDSGAFDGASSSGSSGTGSSGSSGSSGGNDDGGGEAAVDGGIVTTFDVAMTGGGACAVFEDGKMKCWGQANVDAARTDYGAAPGQMGAALPYVPTPAPVKKIVGTSEGGYCAIFVDGTMRCWAMTYSGQGSVGGVSFAELKTNIDVGAGHKIVDVASAISHTCVILDDGKVKCWGQAAFLGSGTATDAQTPPAAELDLGTGRTAKALTASLYFTCAILDDDRVKCWGNGGLLANGTSDNVGTMPGQMGDNLAYAKLGTDPSTMAPWKVKKVVAASTHACAILANGRVKCWGQGSPENPNLGVLGNGDATITYGTTIVDDDIPFVDLDKDNAGTAYTATDIATGDNHVCVNTTKGGGGTYCWGSGAVGLLGLGVPNGAIGDGPNEMGANLAAVGLKPGRVATGLWASYSATCARVDTSVLDCWGSNNQGMLGVGLPATAPSDVLGDDPSEVGTGLLETLLQ